MQNTKEEGAEKIQNKVNDNVQEWEVEDDFRQEQAYSYRTNQV